MNELERIKGTDSVADGLMKSDRNFTKLKLEVENIDVSEQLATKADKTQVVQDIATHNTSIDSHADIRTEIASVKSQSNEIATQLKKDGVILTTIGEQSIPTDIPTLKTWTNATSYKTPASSFFDINNPTKIVIPPDIKNIRLSANIAWLYDNNGVGFRQIRFLKNGVTFLGTDINKIKAHPTTQYQYLQSAIISVVQGDFFEVQLDTTAGIAQIATDGNGGLYGVWFELEVIE